jgi:UDP-3-O-[3-hydroxymyristoyl] N-acetylglucosamine deacetylase
LTSLDGYGLHGGQPGRVRFDRSDGPVLLVVGGVETTMGELVVVDTTRSTTVSTRDGRLRIASVEHLFAALGGLGVHAGLAVRIDGSEVPLVDGGARAFADAIEGLAPGQSAPSVYVARVGTITIGDSAYEFAPSDGVSVEVETPFEGLRLCEQARWDGDRDDFRQRIAPARTFGFAREVDELLARGLARHVTPESVVVLTDEGALSAGAPFSNDEPARHKLLDLIGDLYLCGGPPRGRVRATRPGHAATHLAVAAALEQGVLARDAHGRRRTAAR